MEEVSKNFIETFIDEDLAPGGRCEGMKVHTRFPPEPNGYLHIGHCKALVIDFGTAEKYGGLCNLRMDDTNPTKEDVEYVEAIQEDIHWLGFDWGDRFYYASDYFEKMYECAEDLIKRGLAYVCELSPAEFRDYRGDTNTPARSPWRDRPAEESLDLFRRMRAGEFPEGKYTLRAKIDLASGNFNMRDPVIYRINHAHHHRQGDKWCIYPMYDFAHPIEDAMEHITHSLCSLEFEDHRPLYDWVINNCDLPSKPRQIEFARLGINYTVMSKRKLRRLVEDGRVSGWDDPRMPTLCGLRRLQALIPVWVRTQYDLHAPPPSSARWDCSTSWAGSPDQAGHSPSPRWARYSMFPSGPFIGEKVIPFTVNPASRALSRKRSTTSRWTLGSRTTPFLPTFSRPASNWGFTRHTACPSGFSRPARAGRMSRREIKETSTLAKSRGSGTCSRVR